MKKPRFKFSFNIALLMLLAVLFIVIVSVNPVILKPDYLFGVMLRNIVEIGLMALPVTLIIITGGIDLSVGSILVLSAMAGGLAAAKMPSETFGSFGSITGVAITLLTGTACGLLNGLIIAKLKISPLVTTLATMFLYMGIARGITIGDSVYSYKLSEFFGTTEIAGIPMQIFIYAILAVLFVVILSKTKLGRKLYGIGLNENATRYSGIDTDKVKILIYAISGLMCAFAALIWLGRFTSIKYDAGTALGLKVVTVIVLGGTSILGGYGDMKGTILGTLIVALLNSGLTVMNIPIDMQTIVHGTVLVISLVVFSILNEKAKLKKIISVKVADGEDQLPQDPLEI
ncbi:MAG: ABC transporter permease [Saccharofermentanales bacterium]